MGAYYENWPALETRAIVCARQRTPPSPEFAFWISLQNWKGGNTCSIKREWRGVESREVQDSETMESLTKGVRAGGRGGAGWVSWG